MGENYFNKIPWREARLQLGHCRSKDKEEFGDGVNENKKKKKLDENKIWMLAKEGKTAQQVADELGVSKSSIDKSEGWKQRKNEEFIF